MKKISTAAAARARAYEIKGSCLGKEGQIPGAEQLDNGVWLIPAEWAGKKAIEQTERAGTITVAEAAKSGVSPDGHIQRHSKGGYTRNTTPAREESDIMECRQGITCRVQGKTRIKNGRPWAGRTAATTQKYERGTRYEYRTSRTQKNQEREYVNMAHEFESGFYTRKPAWHGLGIVLKEVPTIEEAIVAAGVDWNVIEKPLYTDLGQTYENKARKDDLVLAKHVATHKALIRETDNSVLGIVGEGYQPVQNKEAFQWFDFLLDSGDATLEAGGSLRNGQRIWVLAKMKDGDGDVLKNDPVTSYMLLSNAHDGSMGVAHVYTHKGCLHEHPFRGAGRSRERGQGRKGHEPCATPTNILDQMEMAKGLVNTAKRTFEDSPRDIQGVREEAPHRQDVRRVLQEVLLVGTGIAPPQRGDAGKSKVYATVKSLYERDRSGHSGRQGNALGGLQRGYGVRRPRARRG